MPYANAAIQSAYQAGYVSGRRTAWIEAHGPCAQCGSAEQLEVDHIDPSTKLTHRVWSLTKEAREAELAKCQVLCRACHRAKTNREQSKPLVHGTLNAYKKKRCRCADCTAAATQYARDLRKKKAAAP